MKVYVVMSWNDDCEEEVHGVFSSHARACEEVNRRQAMDPALDYDIVSWQLDDPWPSPTSEGILRGPP